MENKYNKCGKLEYKLIEQQRSKIIIELNRQTMDNCAFFKIKKKGNGITKYVSHLFIYSRKEINDRVSAGVGLSYINERFPDITLHLLKHKLDNS